MKYKALARVALAGFCISTSAVAQQMTATPPTQPAAPAPVVAPAPAPVVVAPAPAPAPAAPPAAITGQRVDSPTSGTSTLVSNTEIMMRLEEEVSSKKFKVGDTFKLTVLQDVMLGNYIVIPRGTPGEGAVTYRTGKGSFGKSAKMEIEMRSIKLGDRVIPITGHFRQEGEGNTGATVGVAVAAGIFSAFVTGRSAIFNRDREFRAYTGEAIPVSLSAN